MESFTLEILTEDLSTFHECCQANGFVAVVKIPANKKGNYLAANTVEVRRRNGKTIGAEYIFRLGREFEIRTQKQDLTAE